MSASLLDRLERYTAKYPQEVLLVVAEVDGQMEQIVIFKGFSSSLTHPTAFDPDLPVLPDRAAIATVDRLESPYTPDNPRYIQQGLTVDAMQQLLASAGI